MTPAEQAVEIVARLIDNMTSRRGLRQEWDGIDQTIRNEIRSTWEQIVLDVLLEE